MLKLFLHLILKPLKMILWAPKSLVGHRHYTYCALLAGKLARALEPWEHGVKKEALGPASA